MDVSLDQLIDVGLNVVGFLLAGGLILTLSSLLRRRDKSGSPTAGSRGKAVKIADVQGADISRATGGMEFVRLGDGSDRKSPDPKESGVSVPGAEKTRRNRAEVIRMARKMLAESRSPSAVAGDLPISEAELAMLSGK
jgi:hypothetical protein